MCRRVHIYFAILVMMIGVLERNQHEVIYGAHCFPILTKGLLIDLYVSQLKFFD